MNSSTRARAGAPRRVMRVVLLMVALVGLLLAGQRLAPETVPTDAPTTVAAPEPAPIPLDRATLEARVVPTIVTLTASAGPLTTAGTGIVLSEDGLVLTNHHIIDGATDVDAVALATGADYDTEILGYDRFRDVAVLRLVGAGALPVATLGRSAELDLHDPVTAIGNADGGGVALSAPGFVTGLNESVVARNATDGTRNRLTGMIEVDADIRPGDSGGPLVDAFGLVVGVSTAGNTGMRPDPGIGTESTVPIESYALPIDDAVAIADQIRGGRGSETVHIGPTPLLGVAVTNVGPNQDGAKVVAVSAGSPAERAGIVRGDVVVSWNGTPIRSQTDLTVEMTGRHPGDRVEIGWTDATGARRSASLVLETGTP